jgi:WD40 repeat protein
MIQIRDANTGAILKAFDGVSSPTYVSKSIYEGAFSPDGARIVTGFVAGAALWDTATGSLVADLSSGGNVSGVGFSPDGTRVATEADDNTMRIWDTRSGQETHRFTGRSYGAAVAFSPDGSRIAGKAPGFYDIRVWNTSTGKPVVTLKGHSTVIAAVRYSPDGSRLVSVDYDGWIRIWNAATGQELGKTRFADPNEGRAQLYDVDYSPDGSRIATASVDGSVRIWKIEPN